MKKIKTVYWIWSITILFTLFFAYYQRATGPTYPVKGSAIIGGDKISYKLIRSCTSGKGAEIKILAKNDFVTGRIYFKEYKSPQPRNEFWMKRQGDYLSYTLPSLPPSGKMMYQVLLLDNYKSIPLTKKPIILRYKGNVPALILIPHILLMFLAMLFSTRAGIEAILKRSKTFLYSCLTLACLVAGGIILGPFVQKYAFGSFWTGFPFGYDLTDNKTAFALLFWIIAVIVLNKHRENRIWPVIASIMLIIVFLIPHSLLGS